VFSTGKGGDIKTSNATLNSIPLDEFKMLLVSFRTFSGIRCVDEGTVVFHLSEID
jgi:hypothetical protein